MGKANHERFAEEGLISGHLEPHHEAALDSLSNEENEQLIRILKKVRGAVPKDKKEDVPNIF